MEWRTKPTEIGKYPDGVNYIMGMDETGTANHKGIIRRLNKQQPIDINDRHFTLTGITIHRKNYRLLLRESKEIKATYWSDGKYNYRDVQKMICFHSREIRKKEGPFKLNNVEYKKFIRDLSDMIQRQKYEIYSSIIDKEMLCKRYITPYHPYQLAAQFLLERYSMFLNRVDENGIIILESRGRKEDRFVLNHLINILDNGNEFQGRSQFEKIKGIYFNKKWSLNKNTYPILELADLISYPIHKYVRNGLEHKDAAFESIEHKLANYPNYFGKGMKIFPENIKSATVFTGRSTGRPPIHLN